MRIGINGFGRIGRNFLRTALGHSDFDVVAINDPSDIDELAYLMQYDSAVGSFRGSVDVEGDRLSVAGRYGRGGVRRDSLRVLSEQEASRLPWQELGVEVVVETAHTSRQAAEKHKEAGARWVIVTSPMEDPDFTAVIGVNDDGLDAERHRIVSTASHITASVGPVAAVLDKAAGVTSAVSTTLHAYSASSGIAELPSDDLRRTRADGANIVPTSTAASREIARAFPHLNGSFSATSVRLPVADGSLTELVVVLRDAVPAQALNEAFGDAARGMLKGTLSYTEDPIVSRDVIGNASSAVVDGALTCTFGAHARVFAWSDSEWSYANRIADTVDLLQY